MQVVTQVNYSRPSGDNAWQGHGSTKDAATGKSWTLTVYAVCANVS